MQGLGTTERQLRLLQQLASTRQGETVAELAERFGVNQRTIRRDLQRLQAIGFPVDQTTEAHGRQRWLLHGDSILGTGLSFDEAFALVLASLSATAVVDGAAGGRW
ncbi:helix-turn-helix transcriptional regulator [Roseimaritima ulvae]|uniref:HTH domain protein n=1 Tax=Roseimaritima ulvae TaxID=980254 RepID=A0A5B9QNI8_9BACT|nr:HTH domain-containing protein [Roseimaritima ulvae]QEG40534.1 HTH domain protein [Roseimaritima ulvae]